MNYDKAERVARKAYKDVPLYINRSRDNKEEITIHNIPIIKKENLIDRQDECLEPAAYMDYMQNKLICLRTSGSTGHYLQIMWKMSDYQHSMAELWLRRIKYYGIRPDSRLACFFTDNRFEEDKNYVRKNNELAISKLLILPETIDEAYRMVMDWNPEWMILQPSTAAVLVEYIKRTGAGTPDALKYIEFTGEILTDDLRAAVQNVFNCRTADQYGANEVNSIAYECPCGNRHIMSSNVMVEIADENDNVICDSITPSDCTESGRIILTSLTNTAMPFIRYDIGDVGKIIWEPCKCGNHNPILSLSGGRCNDYIYLNETDRISPYILVAIFDKVNMILDGAIIQFYVEQTAYDELNITLYTDGDVYEDEVSDTFMSCIDNECLKHMKYHITYTEHSINTGTNGKYTYFRDRRNSK